MKKIMWAILIATLTGLLALLLRSIPQPSQALGKLVASLLQSEFSIRGLRPRTTPRRLAHRGRRALAHPPRRNLAPCDAEAPAPANSVPGRRVSRKRSPFPLSTPT